MFFRAAKEVNRTKNENENTGEDNVMTDLLTSGQCLARYGDPVEENNMAVWNIPLQLQPPHVSQRRVYCNKDLIPLLEKAFTNLADIRALGEIKTFDGCFNIRMKRGGTSSSLHSWGMAIDINAATNRFCQRPMMPSVVVECFEKAGFDWGGRWALPDGMHFQAKAAEIIK